RPPHRHFERSRPTLFPFTFAPANVSACGERNLSSLLSLLTFNLQLSTVNSLFPRSSSLRISVNSVPLRYLFSFALPAAPSFRTQQADAFSFRLAPARRSACEERNLS